VISKDELDVYMYRMTTERSRVCTGAYVEGLVMCLFCKSDSSMILQYTLLSCSIWEIGIEYLSIF